ncbi:2-dehydro-3-deoxy-D-gluconate 5-dehydrogenase KduD [Saxibacter everestensis]|uniref:2-dehydro-3-deoxy-D-gluconate 5-dehydrogenase KduD n=1 Tax=Saxibacter everestensis TaxID=2909229 RepID=A0ABY8R0D5_9MICO|nr:2-dehydro-3-deoxy-D-gluconate 5-dehydrogenase KduD [Brevibacteriaceae bacterium ZFBP1038]
MSFSPAAFSLTGKTAVVTGARRGIGQEVAAALASAGADLILLARDTDLEATLSRIEALGRSARIVTADLESPEAAQRVATELAETVEVDILVNNAGMILRDDAVDYDYASWQRVLDVNLNSAWLLSQQIGAAMVARGSGKIVNIASLLSFQGGIRVPAYAASKHGIVGVTKALANEWAAANVQVNAIAPGYIATDNTEELQSDAARSAEIIGRIPAGRWGAAADIAGAAVFLSSPAADYINGHVLAVDGGWLAR